LRQVVADLLAERDANKAEIDQPRKGKQVTRSWTIQDPNPELQAEGIDSSGWVHIIEPLSEEELVPWKTIGAAYGGTYEQNLSNAKLMAAAPSMYNFLRRLRANVPFGELRKDLDRLISNLSDL
jgi:hypothetical protein